MKDDAILLRNSTGCGLQECHKALIYSNNNYELAVAYLKAKSYAVVIKDKDGNPISFDERVKKFL